MRPVCGMPAIDKERPGPGHRHYLGKRHVVGFIELLPDWAELSKGLDAILLSSVASAVHWRLGTIEPALLLNLLTGSIPGVLLGASLASRSPSRSVRWSIALLVLLSGVSMFTGSCHRWPRSHRTAARW